jgi:hypothetical protein
MALSRIFYKNTPKIDEMAPAMNCFISWPLFFIKKIHSPYLYITNMNDLSSTWVNEDQEISTFGHAKRRWREVIMMLSVNIGIRMPVACYFLDACIASQTILGFIITSAGTCKRWIYATKSLFWRITLLMMLLGGNKIAASVISWQTQESMQLLACSHCSFMMHKVCNIHNGKRRLETFVSHVSL